MKQEERFVYPNGKWSMNRAIKVAAGVKQNVSAKQHLVAISARQTRVTLVLPSDIVVCSLCNRFRDSRLSIETGISTCLLARDLSVFQDVAKTEGRGVSWELWILQIASRTCSSGFWRLIKLRTAFAKRIVETVRSEIRYDRTYLRLKLFGYLLERNYNTMYYITLLLLTIRYRCQQQQWSVTAKRNYLHI